jgi:hypothetical protein
MLVDVVCLRIKGEPRPRAEVLAAMRTSPVRGELQLDNARPGWYPGKRDAPKLAGLVVPGATDWALPPLDNARVEKIRGQNLLILGYEEIPRDRRNVVTYRQAWWCRLVLDGGAPGVDAEVMELATALLDRIKRQRRRPPGELAEVALAAG